jgi:hypothetical protein
MAGQVKKYPILQVIYDEESNNLLLVVPPGSEGLYRKQYGRIGQKITEIGNLIQRQRWPHFMCDIPWTHVMPVNDVVEHTHSSSSFECQCNPMVDTVKRIVLHEAMNPSIEKFNNSPLAINPEWKTVEP